MEHQEHQYPVIPEAPYPTRNPPNRDTPYIQRDRQHRTAQPGNPREQPVVRARPHNRTFISSFKSLKYTGQTSWKAFYTKFNGYARQSGWTEDQKRDQLCWSLDGKAIEYFTILLDGNPNISYADTVARLEKRFGFLDLPATLMLQFQIHRRLGRQSFNICYSSISKFT